MESFFFIRSAWVCLKHLLLYYYYATETLLWSGLNQPAKLFWFILGETSLVEVKLISPTAHWLQQFALNDPILFRSRILPIIYNHKNRGVTKYSSFYFIVHILCRICNLPVSTIKLSMWDCNSVLDSFQISKLLNLKENTIGTIFVQIKFGEESCATFLKLTHSTPEAWRSP